MRLIATAFALIGLISACGSRSDTIEGDLAAASEIVQVPAEFAEPIGRDRYGFTSPNSEATLDVFRVEASVVERFEVFEAPRGEVIEFVRNPVSLGALANVLDAADSIVVILIPLLDPTRDFGVDFDGFFVALDSAGSVVAADYPATTIERLDELFEFGRREGDAPAEILAVTADAINTQFRTAAQDELVDILLGG